MIGVGSIPANPDAQYVPSFSCWRFEIKLSPFFYREDPGRMVSILPLLPITSILLPATVQYYVKPTYYFIITLPGRQLGRLGGPAGLAGPGVTE